MVVATLGLGVAILAESSEFLGFGVPPPTPSWGAMLSGSGRTYMLQAPWMAVFPGIAISLAVFGFNMLGDALRDLLDPKLRGRGMKAITVEPKKPGTALEDVPEPEAHDGSVLVEAIAVGVCGTDVEIVEGKYGWAPRGKTRLVLGHESLGRVVDPGPTGGLRIGDLVVGIVRRPDPVPCPNCAVGEWDMCRNGQYTERGIKQIDGFMSERWRIEPEYAMKVDRSLGLLGVLLEPTTVVTKAWEQIVAVGQRAFWEPRTVLITGAGPMVFSLPSSGSSAVWTFTSSIGRIPNPSRTLSAPSAQATTPVPLQRVGFEPDVIVECTGVGQVIADSIRIHWGGWHRVSHGRWHRRPHYRATHGRCGGWRRCCGTTSSSAASTPTSGTGTRPEKSWPVQTAPGWRNS